MSTIITTQFYSINTKNIREGSWDTTWRILPNVLLERPHHGSWRCHYSTGSVDVPSKHIVVIPTACRHRLVKSSKGRMYSDWVYLSWQVNGQDLHLGDKPLIIPATVAKAQNACFAHSQNIAQDAQAQSSALNILAHCLEKTDTQISSDNRIQRCIAFMLKHLDQDIDRNVLAAQCHLSATRFHDVFIAATGVAPMRYLTRLRLRRAQSLLKTNNDALSKIAANCGFQSQAYFNRVFKNAFGVSPGTYRKQ